VGPFSVFDSLKALIVVSLEGAANGSLAGVIRVKLSAAKNGSGLALLNDSKKLE